MRLLVGVHDSYFEQFLGDDSLAELLPLYEPIRRALPGDFPGECWPALFAEFRPDVVVTCWGTPRIPATAFPALRYVAHLAGGVRDIIDRGRIEQGLLVTNWGSTMAPAVAECALLLMLSTLRRSTLVTLAMHRDRLWPGELYQRTRSLFGRTVGLHGFGRIARQLISLLQPFGCRIIAYSAGVPRQVFQDAGVTAAPSLEDLFDQSEVLVEVEALTEATRHTVTESLLRRLRPGASFVNVGRGAVVDEAALIRIATEGRLEIGLDVYETEPLPADSPLRGLPNVTLSPHLAGGDLEQRRNFGKVGIDHLKRFARGQALQDLITPEIYDRST